jgi:hypothetical protein
MSRNKFADRRLFFYFLFGGSAVLLLITLFGIQVINNSYKISAENNVIKAVTIYPERGYIYDREGVLLVTNQRAYDLMVTPRQVRLLDTLALCEIINIDLEYFNKNIFDPLEMTDTGFSCPEEKKDRLAALYEHDPRGSPRLLEIPFLNTRHLSGGGGLFSTMSDYYNFCSMIINQGEFKGKRLIGRKCMKSLMAREFVSWMRSLLQV